MGICLKVSSLQSRRAVGIKSGEKRSTVPKTREAGAPTRRGGSASYLCMELRGVWRGGRGK